MINYTVISCDTAFVEVPKEIDSKKFTQALYDYSYTDEGLEIGITIDAGDTPFIAKDEDIDPQIKEFLTEVFKEIEASFNPDEYHFMRKQ